MDKNHNNIEKKNFADVLEVVDYLISKGWRLARSSFYRHQRDGKIRPQTDGTFTLATVNKYAKTFLKPCDATTLLERAFERELVKRADVFRGDLEAFFRTRAAEIIALVAGEPGKVSDLIKYLFDQTKGCGMIMPGGDPWDLCEADLRELVKMLRF